MTRRQLRENIFKILFRIEFSDKVEWDEQLDLYVEELIEPLEEYDDETGELIEHKEVSDLDIAYIKQKVKAIFACVDELDALITDKTDGWNLNRIGKVELAILRLAVYEIKFDEDVPQGAAINEAVELAKIYCAEEAKGFVNAILAKLAE